MLTATSQPFKKGTSVQTSVNVLTNLVNEMKKAGVEHLSIPALEEALESMKR